MKMPKSNRNYTKETITVKEASKLLGCSPKRIYKLVHNQILIPVKVPGPIMFDEVQFRRAVGLSQNDPAK